MSDSRKYTSVFPHAVQRSREQHYSENDVRQVRHMFCASNFGATGHVCACTAMKGFHHDMIAVSGYKGRLAGANKVPVTNLNQSRKNISTGGGK
eukprot:663437-Pelagomonas_calceolata.AAC.1